MRAWHPISDLWQDLRYALRGMRRSPGFTAAAVLSLALGIGANTAIFSLVHALLLRTLPVRQPGQLVELLNLYPGDPPVNAFSLASFEYFRDRNHVFSGLTGANATRFHVRGDGREPETLYAECVPGNFFALLGVTPSLGRLTGPADDRAGAAESAVAVLSWSYWNERFNLDPAVLGKRILVEDVPLTVVGVMPRAFTGLEVGSRPDIWAPLAAASIIRHSSRPDGWGLRLIGRLKPGVSIEQARAEMAVLYRWTIEERAKSSQDPVIRQMKIRLALAGAGLSTELRDRFAQPLWALMALVGLLLLIACINVAHMLLARGAARQKEMAVRVSLGAGRFRLARQVLTESLLLSAWASLIGVAMAYWGAGALARIMTSGRPVIGLPPHIDLHASPDAQVLLFTSGAALLTGVLFGLAPAWHAAAAAPGPSLRQAGRAGGTRAGRRFGKILVVVQVALSVLLLSAAAVFVRYLSSLEHIGLGFRRDHVLLVTLDPAGSGYDAARLCRAYQQLLERLKSIPGVSAVSLSAGTPLSGAGASRLANVEGHPERPEDRRYLSLNWVAPRYFETLGTPFLAGRDFTSQDQGGPRVAIVNQAMARYYFADGNPIGRHFTFDADGQPYEIVGLVGDAHYYEIREAAKRTIYLDTFQAAEPGSQFSLRTAIPPDALAPEVRRVVRESLKTIPVAKIVTLAGQVDASIVPERLIAALSGWFGAVGSVLAAIGLYGLLAYTVARRIHEIGIRLALGATPRGVRRMVLGEALRMVWWGLAIGIPIGFCGGRFAASRMADLPVNGIGPMAFGAAAMAALALVAAYVPARRAARVDPAEALRCE